MVPRRPKPGPVAVVWRDPASHTGAWLLPNETLYPGLCLTLGWLHEDPDQPDSILVVNSLVREGSLGQPPSRVNQATALGGAHVIPWGCIESITPIHFGRKK